MLRGLLLATFFSLCTSVCQATTFRASSAHLAERAPAAARPAEIAERATNTCPPNKIIANYWPNWVSKTTQPISKIPWQYSDITFWFAAVTVDGGFQVAEASTSPREFARLAHKRGSKALLTIGGWGASQHFSTLVNSKNRKSFASKIVRYINQNELDGVDLDWEYPNSKTVCGDITNPADTANFLAFLKVLRAQLGNKKLITAAVSTTGFKSADGSTPISDASGFAQVLDYLIIMAYDLSGSWSATTGPHSALFDTCSQGDAPSGSTAVKYWTGAGFQPCQLLLGIPSYAHSFTTVSSKLSPRKVGNQVSYAYQQKKDRTPKGEPADVWQKPSTDACGNKSAGGYNGVWHWNTMISSGILRADGKRGLKGYTRYFDKCSQTPFLFNPTSKAMIFYDDPESVAAKSAWVKKQGLAGIAVYDSTSFTSRVYNAARANL